MISPLTADLRLLKRTPILRDLENEVRALFKTRGTAPALSTVHRREADLVRGVEEAVDSDPKRSGVLEELTAECRRHAAKRPDDASWRFLEGRLLMAAGDPDEARNALERAAALDPRDPRIKVHLALWYETALLAATGARMNVELPAAAGPDLASDGDRFVHADGSLPITALAQRALALFEETLRFRLPRCDTQFIRRNIDVVRRRAQHDDARESDEALAAALLRVV